MLSWIPILGPIIEGVVSIFAKYRDTDLARYQTTLGTQVEEAKVSAQIITATKDDILLRILRDLVIAPVVVWTMLLCYDTIIAESAYSEYMWHLASFEKTGAPYLPYAVLIFLLGNIGINTWSRK